jgi:hypothetical protein
MPKEKHSSAAIMSFISQIKLNRSLDIFFGGNGTNAVINIIASFYTQQSGNKLWDSILYTRGTMPIR